MMYPKNSKKYQQLKEEYAKVTTSLKLKKDKKRKKDRKKYIWVWKKIGKQNRKKINEEYTIS